LSGSGSAGGGGGGSRGRVAILSLLCDVYKLACDDWVLGMDVFDGGPIFAEDTVLKLRR